MSEVEGLEKGHQAKAGVAVVVRTTAKVTTLAAIEETMATT